MKTAVLRRESRNRPSDAQPAERGKRRRPGRLAAASARRVSRAAEASASCGVAEPVSAALRWRCRMSEASAYRGMAGRGTAPGRSVSSSERNGFRARSAGSWYALARAGRYPVSAQSVRCASRETAYRMNSRASRGLRLVRETPKPQPPSVPPAVPFTSAGRMGRTPIFPATGEPSRLREPPDVRPVAEEDGAAVLEEAAALVLLVRRDAGRADARRAPGTRRRNSSAWRASGRSRPTSSVCGFTQKPPHARRASR